MSGEKLAKPDVGQRNLFGQRVAEVSNEGAGAKGKKEPVVKEKTGADLKMEET